MTITVGIAGITGKFGGLVLANLLKYPDVNIRGFCRNPSKLSERIGSSATHIQITQGSSDNVAALNTFVRGADVVICTYLGDRDLMVTGQMLLVDACERHGVPRYIASDYSLDYTKLEPGQLPAKDPMRTVKEYIETKQNVRGVHVFIGGFMETILSSYFRLWNAGHKAFEYWGSGDEVWESTTYRNAAEYVAAVAVDRGAVGVKNCNTPLSVSFALHFFSNCLPYFCSCIFKRG